MENKIDSEIEINRDGGGNTKKPPSQPLQYHHMGFTWNNYTNRDIDILIKILDEKCYMYVFQEEVGEKTSTKHLQGTMSFIKRSRFTELGLPKQVHFEFPIKQVAESYRYCSDINKRHGNCYSKNYDYAKNIDVISKDCFFDYQLELLYIIKNKPHNRNIYWITGEQGIGKSQLQKYFVVHHKAQILSGKPSDMKNGIVSYYKINNNTPKLIISNIGYDKNVCNIHYSGYEDIKDMLFYSGKYEGGMICGNNPHLLIFANESFATDNKKFIEIKANKDYYNRDKYYSKILLNELKCYFL